VCDHGTPTRAVHAVREAVVAQVAAMLDKTAVSVRSCSMERRDGEAFAFNDPLLENAVADVGNDHDTGQADGVVVALLFLGPGKHAGPGGDVATIVQSAQSGLPVHITNVIGADPLVRDILLDRVAQAVQLL
jgi:sirohydrochlorin ferrochelatase